MTLVSDPVLWFLWCFLFCLIWFSTSQLTFFSHVWTGKAEDNFCSRTQHSAAVRLGSPTPQSQVKHSTTDPMCPHDVMMPTSYKWAMAWDFQQCGMCKQLSLRSACAYVQSDQSLCSSLEYSMTVKLLTEHHYEFLSWKGAAQACLSLHLWKCHIVGNHISGLKLLCHDGCKLQRQVFYHCSLYDTQKEIWMHCYQIQCVPLHLYYSFNYNSNKRAVVKEECVHPNLV